MLRANEPPVESRHSPTHLARLLGQTRLDPDKPPPESRQAFAGLSADADDFRVVAIISAFNEEDIIDPILAHLGGNGVETYLIDNRSTDDTVERARAWFGRGLIGIESFPA